MPGNAFFVGAKATPNPVPDPEVVVAAERFQRLGFRSCDMLLEPDLTVFSFGFTLAVLIVALAVVVVAVGVVDVFPPTALAAALALSYRFALDNDVGDDEVVASMAAVCAIPFDVVCFATGDCVNDGIRLCGDALAILF